MRLDRIGWTSKALGAIALAALVGRATSPAHAPLILDIEQVGANVVANYRR